MLYGWVIFCLFGFRISLNFIVLCGCVCGHRVIYKRVCIFFVVAIVVVPPWLWFSEGKVFFVWLNSWLGLFNSQTVVDVSPVDLSCLLSFLSTPPPELASFRPVFSSLLAASKSRLWLLFLLNAVLRFSIRSPKCKKVPFRIRSIGIKHHTKSIDIGSISTADITVTIGDVIPARIVIDQTSTNRI